MSGHIIYLDHAATTPLDPRVLDAMMPYFTTQFGNASSGHILGKRAMQALEHARKQVAECIHSQSDEIIFVGCGSESDNLAIKGIVYASRARGNHIITSSIEHDAVLHTCQSLEGAGFEVTYLPVDEYGRVNPDDVGRAITDRTVLVSIMYANNEVGTIEPVEGIGRICRAKKVPFHIDAVQAGGAIPIDVEALNVDLLSLSAHKFYGPKGVGILYVRQGTNIISQLQGGPQEHGLRAGTENVAGVVGAAEALYLAQEEMSEVTARIKALRDRLINGIQTIPESRLMGHPTDRLPNNTCFCFKEVASGTLIRRCLNAEKIAASTGSACSTGSRRPSHVLTAMGLPPEWSLGSLRLTLGKENTEADIDRVIRILPAIIEELRNPDTIESTLERLEALGA